MKNIFLLSIVLILSLFVFTGCSNEISADSFYYVIGLGIDKSDNNLLKISIQISKNSKNSQGSSSSMSDNYHIYTVEADSIDSGINILNNYLNKRVNLSQCSAIVFSEEIAKAGISEHITSLANNTQLRHSCKIIVCSSIASDVLKNVSKAGETYSARLYDYLTNSADYTGYSIKSTFGKVFKDLNNINNQANCIYTLITKDTVQNYGIAVFKEDIMVGHLNMLNTVAHLIVTNELEHCIISVNSPFKDDDQIYLDLELFKNTEINVDIINNSPFINIDIYPKCNINSSGNHFDYTIDDNISKVERAVNIYLSNLVKEYLYNISKEYNSDIAGLGVKASSNYLTKEEFDKIHWDDIFKDSFFVVNTHTLINSSNLLNKK